MGIYRILSLKRKSNKNKSKSKQQNKVVDPVNRSLEQNIYQIKDMFKDCSDVIYREFEVGNERPINAAVIFIDGMIDKELLNEQIIKPLMLEIRISPINLKDVRLNIYELLEKKSMTVSDIEETHDMQKTVDAVLSGDTVLLLDGYDKAFIIASKGWPTRGVSQPETEAVIRGSRDGFTETIRVNTVLVRRRIRDTNFKVKSMSIGQRSKTDIAILYIDDIVDKQVLNEVENRLSDISIDGVLESGYIEQFIEDNWLSPFPQIQNTERPDSVAAAVLEGRVAILIDNTPFALIVPATLNSFFQSPEDYYERWIIGSFIRMMRFVAGLFSLIISALYVAITSYHPGIIPTKLALSIAGNREGVPFPAIIEAFIMEITLEMLREAGVRLPGPIGQTIGIVGGIIIGQAAVEAGIVSSIMVIIVAFSAISSFAIPNYSVAIGFRVLRFVLIFLAAFLGLYGIMLGLLAVLIHMVTLKSFGVPYLTPFTMNNANLLKDSVIRVPIPAMKERPGFTAGDDKVRIGQGPDKQKSGDKNDDKG
ncbi:MAG: spore germination protein [Clostridia bacterium]|nr:spore germination protein [Clostridia bacterium]